MAAVPMSVTVKSADTRDRVQDGEPRANDELTAKHELKPIYGAINPVGGFP